MIVSLKKLQKLISYKFFDGNCKINEIFFAKHFNCNPNQNLIDEVINCIVFSINDLEEDIQMLGLQVNKMQFILFIIFIIKS